MDQAAYLDAHHLAAMMEELLKLQTSLLEGGPGEMAPAPPLPQESLGPIKRPEVPLENCKIPPPPLPPDEKFPPPPRVSPAEKARMEKIWRAALSSALVYLVLLVTVSLVVHIKEKGGGGTPPAVFGYRGMSVMSGSMEPEIPKGTFIIIKNIDPDQLHVGDDITCATYGGMTRTHRIVEIYEDYREGKRAFRTKGINNGPPDSEPVLADDVIGRVVYNSPALGAATAFVQEKPVLFYLLCLTLLIAAIAVAVTLAVIRKKNRYEKLTQS